MEEFWARGPAAATVHVYRAAQRMAPCSLAHTTPRRRTGLSGALPRVPAVVDAAADQAQRAVLRRRRLLAIFARMMARFHERHERRWSMGRWECAICHERINAWAWLPQSSPGGALHEACVSRSMWDVVLHHERLAQAARQRAGD
jgi:ribosomal protein L37AE/L43A